MPFPAAQRMPPKWNHVITSSLKLFMLCQGEKVMHAGGQPCGMKLAPMTALTEREDLAATAEENKKRDPRALFPEWDPILSSIAFQGPATTTKG